MLGYRDVSVPRIDRIPEIVKQARNKSNDSGLEVRCIMPRFGVINERRHRLHEVVRLSGINVSVDNDDYPLQIKVASLPNARLQVYFLLDNEDFLSGNSFFMTKRSSGLMITTCALFSSAGCTGDGKEIRVASDIIHCSGWMTGLVPLFT